MQTHAHLLARAGELLAGADPLDDYDVDALLAAAATRIALEARLRAITDSVVQNTIRHPCLGVFALALRAHGVLTMPEREAVIKLARITSKAVHRGAVDFHKAEKCHDFAVELLERLESRL